ncbi:MAG: AAA family ATPase [Actinomycetota bacterium]|nr:AAA family ATPase [Actinomycetota bacterium]
MTAVAGQLRLKLGVVGKGGVGKTTVSGLLARAYHERGKQVVAIDTDSNPNLGMSLGLSLADTEAVPVLPRSAVVGAGGTAVATELIAEYGRPTPAGPTLLSAIKVAAAGAGCTCSGHATVRSLLADALQDVDTTLVDMEAGLEHLSRSGGTLAHADLLLVVCEPTRKSVLTAARTATLAAELGIPGVLAVGNKARTPEDVAYFRDALAAEQIELAGVLPYDAVVAAADRTGAVGLSTVAPEVQRTIGEVLDALDAAQRRTAIFVD